MISRRLLVAVAGGALAAGCHHKPRSASVPVPLPEVPAPFASAPVQSAAPDVADLVQRVRRSVVNITAVHEFVVPLPQRIWPPGGSSRIVKEQSLGSGFIIDYAGHVATNAHVVDAADVVEVRLADDRRFRAHVIAKDESLDLAVLQIQNAPPGLPAASLGSSSKLRVGDYVVAIGNPFGLGDTVTMGIVSAKDRSLGAGPYDDFIQTDAPINPGNSGGPLFDLYGQVVGINSAIAPRGQGIGFAIPIDAVKKELPQLIATGRVARGRLGVTVQGVDDTLARALGLARPHGALLANVEPAGPAARSGLEPGDVIVAVDGREVAHAVDLPWMIASHSPGSRVRLGVVRDGHERDFDVTLGALRRSPQGVTAPQAPGGG